jgi:hypothetical protein
MQSNKHYMSMLIRIQYMNMHVKIQCMTMCEFLVNNFLKIWIIKIYIMHYGEKDDLVIPNVYIYSRGLL